MSHLEGLNNQQKKAVLHKEGPLVILAGAGAGKTRVITHRILHLIQSGVAPEQILAVTFTNKAAGEMRDRVNTLIREDTTINRPLSIHARPFVATFHSLGVHLLRKHGKYMGIPQRFTIYDRNDSIRAVKEAIKKAGLDPKEYEPRTFLSGISKQKGLGIHVNQYREEVGTDYFPQLVARVWSLYQDILKENNALDFDDLLLNTSRLLSNHESVRKACENTWHYIHVDEYQDTNKVQDDITRLLAGATKNICVVGDGDQNIYGWRGADIENILQFEERYPQAQTLLLEENYRSTKNILAAANVVIAKNKRRKEKNLFTKNVDGELLTLIPTYDENEEAMRVAERAKTIIKQKVAPREIAVLYRANFQSRVLEEAFLTLDIPYQVLGVRFFERKEVKDMLSFVRAALNPENIPDLKRIINIPPRGIGKVTLLKMVMGKESELSARMKEKVASFKKLLMSTRDSVMSAPASRVLKHVLYESRLERILKEGSEDDVERLENIRELVTLAGRYDDLPAPEGIERLLDDAALASEQDSLESKQNAVKLMTVHASKGLEFDYVFITGLEEGLFPHQALSEKNDDPEEERRLFYVALTRARKKVFLLFASVRTIFGSREVTIPSSFITDIDNELIELEDPNHGTERVIYMDEL